MPGSIIAYDRDLPEIPDRLPWDPPDCYLVKDSKATGGWRIEDTGRRPSSLPIIPRLRQAVDTWRNGGYPGASEVTRRLFEYWFADDHVVADFPAPFRYRFCMREAMETLAYLVEIAQVGDARRLVEVYADIHQADLLSKNIEFYTTVEGTRKIRRYHEDLGKIGEQELPPQDLWRYAFKMATGSGKTWVMAMVMVWSHYHARRVQGSPLSTNFLVVAPNVIVFQRLEKDFRDNKIFKDLPLVPPEWGPWSQKVILRGDSAEPDPSGNLFLTNIQQLYESRDDPWTPANAVDAILGRKPVKDLASHQRSMLERIKDLPDLVVMNDEAHHVHREDLAWSRSLVAINDALPKGLALWLDFSATPKDQNGMYYPWTICDYPLAQAVEDRIVKAPIIVTKEDDPHQPQGDPEGVTKANVAVKYGYWLKAAVKRYREHEKVYRGLGIKPVLFIMMEKNAFADAVGRCLWELKEYGFKEKEVLVIHTDSEGEITKGDLDVAREAARDIDRNTYKVIVSVMMLREGWDVRNVSVVLGLRPFTAAAQILPEQVIGRGLRLVLGAGPDRTQTLEVLGTKPLLKVLREQLEAEGVGVGVSKSTPAQPVLIEPVKEKLALDIAIPITKPRLVHEARRVADLDPMALAPIFDQQVDLDEVFRIRLRMDFADPEVEIHQEDIGAGDAPLPDELVATITRQVIARAGLGPVFADLFPKVRLYLRERCFGRAVDLDADNVRSHLHRVEILEGIVKYLASEIAKLTIVKRAVEVENAAFKLSGTKPFQWRRDLPPMTSNRTIFNYVATYNKFERAFAEFLGKAPDVLRFASLGTTEQGDSGTLFRIDYLKPSGAIGFYHPDWVVVRATPDGEESWIIETKGRVYEGTQAKDTAMADWCARVTALTGKVWRFARVNQVDFQRLKPKFLSEAVAAPGASPQQPLPVGNGGEK